MIQYGFSWVAWLLLLTASLFIRHAEKSWLAPASLFSLVWCFIVGLSLLLAPEYYFSPIAILFILAIVVSFFCGSVFANTLLKVRFQHNCLISSSNINFKIATKQILIYRFFVLIASVLGFIASLILIKSYQSDFISLLNYNEYMKFSNLVSTDRYDGVSMPTSTVLLLTIAYSGCIISTVLFSLSNKWLDKLMPITSLLPILMLTILSTSRAVFLFAIFLVMGTYISSLYLKNRIYIKLFNAKSISIFLSASCIIVFMFVFTQASRMNADISDTSDLSGVLEHLKVWFAGNVSGFSYWIDHSNWLQQSQQYGALTFSGVFEKFGLLQRKLGVFNDYVDASGNGAQTNIYTLFRFFVYDFTAIGSLIMMFILGSATSFLIKNIKQNQFSSVIILGGIYSLLLFSFITSIYAYNSTLIAVVISAFLFVVFPPQKQTNG